MRILFLTNEIPYFTGGGTPIRDYNLLSHLMDRHHFSVVCFADPDEEETNRRTSASRLFCQDLITIARQASSSRDMRRYTTTIERLAHPLPWRVRVLSTAAIRFQVENLLRTNSFDVVHANHVELGSLLALAKNAGLVVGHEVVTPKLERIYQLESGSRRRLSSYLEWKKCALYERRLFRRVDLCTMVSDLEAAHVHKVAPQTRVDIIPNGVDTAYFQPVAEQSHDPDQRSILFIGSMAYQPNLDAVLYFHREIWPLLTAKLPNTVWWIVGRNPPQAIQELQSDRVKVTGWVQDVRPYMARSQVMIVPLRSGGGSRLKILEAMAARLPVVSTTIGAEGLDVKHPENILLADTGPEFAEMVIRLVGNRDMAQTLAENARRLVAEQYEWRMIADHLDTAYQSLGAT